MFAVIAKIYECSINSPALSLLMKHLVIGQRLKTPNFSAFHWSPRGSLVSIGQDFIATRIVHLPKSTETSLITESDQRTLSPAIAAMHSPHSQAVRAVHNCNSWFINIFPFTCRKSMEIKPTTKYICSNLFKQFFFLSYFSAQISRNDVNDRFIHRKNYDTYI